MTISAPLFRDGILNPAVDEKELLAA